LAKAKDFCSRPRPRPRTTLKAKAKDLTFKAKAKAKDSKFVVGDSSRPRTKAKDNNTGQKLAKVFRLLISWTGLPYGNA